MATATDTATATEAMATAVGDSVPAKINATPCFARDAGRVTRDCGGPEKEKTNTLPQGGEERVGQPGMMKARIRRT